MTKTYNPGEQIGATEAEFWLLDYIAGEYNVTLVDIHDMAYEIPEVLNTLASAVAKGFIVPLSDHTWELTDKGAIPFGGIRDEVRDKRENLRLL